MTTPDQVELLNAERAADEPGIEALVEEIGVFVFVSESRAEARRPARGQVPGE